VFSGFLGVSGLSGLSGLSGVSAVSGFRFRVLGWGFGNGTCHVCGRHLLAINRALPIHTTPHQVATGFLEPATGFRFALSLDPEINPGEKENAGEPSSMS